MNYRKRESTNDKQIEERINKRIQLEEEILDQELKHFENLTAEQLEGYIKTHSITAEELRNIFSKEPELTFFKNKIISKESITTKANVKDPNHEILYKRIDSQRFINSGYKSNEHDFQIEKGSYLTNRFNDIFKDINTEETLLLNFGTGVGKSTLIYKYIEKIYEETDDYIFICSPFIKLVDKDRYHLTVNSPIDNSSIFEYRMLDDKELREKHFLYKDSQLKELLHFMMFKEFGNSRIQILTTNMLLKNPGEASFEQSKIKEDYLNYLYKKLKSEERKIHLIFDEIHESIHCFSSKYIFNLIKWKDLVKKAIISTATYTEPIYIVAKHLAYLTDDTINIFQGNRVKYNQDLSNWEDFASLEIHITEDNYSANKIESFDYIYTWLENSELFQILTYSKQLAKELKREIEKELEKDNINLITSDSRDGFRSDESSIGTSFKTGCNFKDGTDYIIILPSNNQRFEINNDVFYSGVPSILQSIGRLRGKGRILIIMPPPVAYINPPKSTIPSEELEEHEYLIQTSIFPDVKYFENLEEEDLQYKELETYYNRQYENINNIEQSYNESLEDEVNRPQIQFPSIDEFVLSEGEQYLKSLKYQYGRNISPYVLWAAINDQFINCKLSHFSRLIPYELKIQHSSSDGEIVDFLFDQLFTPLDREEISKLDFNEEVIDTIYDNLCYSKYEGRKSKLVILSNNEILRFKQRGNGIHILNLYLKIKGLDYRLTLKDYFNVALNLSNASEISELKKIIELINSFPNNMIHKNDIIKYIADNDLAIDFNSVELSLEWLEKNNPFLKFINAQLTRNFKCKEDIIKAVRRNFIYTHTKKKRDKSDGLDKYILKDPPEYIKLQELTNILGM